MPDDRPLGENEPLPPAFPPGVAEGLRQILDQLADVADDSRRSRQASEHADQNVNRLRAELGEVRDIALRADARAERLEKEVYGSKPPPPLAPSVPVIRRVSEAEIETDELRGVVLRVASRVEEVAKMNEKQSKAMGLDAHGLAFLRTRSGRKDLLQFVTLVVAMLGTVAAIFGKQASTSVHGERVEVPRVEVPR